MAMNAMRATLREALWRWGHAPAIATLSLLLLANPAQAAPPTFQAISAIAASTGADVTVTLPAHQADDILLLIGVVRDQNDTVTVTGWTQMTGSPFDRAGVSRYWVFWKRAASASETNPVFNKSGGNGDTYAAVINYRGALATGDPWEVKGAAATGTTDPAVCTGISTLTDDSLVVAALAGEDNNNGSVTTTATNPATYAEHYLESVTGGDGMVAFSEAARTTAGPTGNVSVNFNSGNPVGWGCMVLALKPTTPPPAAGGFNAYETSTASGAVTGVIKTRIAGSTVSLDMIALNAAKTAIATTFTGTVRVEVLNSSDNTGALDANGCRPTWSVIQTLSPDPAFIAGDNGRKTISLTQANSYPNARLRITYPAGAPTVTGCSTDNFAIRPNTFANFAVTDTDWQTTGTPGARALNLLTFAATTPTHKAGRPFSVRATARNAAGTPATTTNYTGAPTATLSACAGAACTATFGTLTLAATFVAGQLTSDVASYDNVGSFRVELVDSSFASVDAGDSSALEREIRSGTIDVGRFVPDHFAVSLNTPVFGTACGAFTYIGQAFNYTTAPVITVTAQDFANNTTTLYNTIGSWFRITNASLTGKVYSAAAGTLDTTGLPGTDPAITFTGAGVGTLTFGSGSGLSFTRTTPTAPASPYNADISLAINVIDADGVTLVTNPARFSQATSGNGIAFSAGKPMRFGRIRIANAIGSTLLDLPLSLTSEYYDGNYFVTNTLDSCTTLLASDIRFAFVAGTSLASCETATNPAGNIYFNGGLASAFAPPASVVAPKLVKPGAANNGAVDLTVNLNGASGNTCTAVGAAYPSATNADKPWLQGNWGTITFDSNPQGRFTFGTFKAAEEFIYLRENY